MKKIIASFLAFSLMTMSLVGCVSTENTSTTVEQQVEKTIVTETPVEEDVVADETLEQEELVELVQENPFNVIALSGPTAIGMLNMMDDGLNVYDILGAPDEAVTKIISGQADIVAMPANLASTVYNKTEGGISVIAVNTLGVLYVVEVGDTVNSMEDLEGRTIYSTGQGSTPEYGFKHILAAADIADVTMEFKTETSELALLLSEGLADLAILPQPFVTTAITNNPDVRVALDLSEEWETYSDGQMITGVLVVRNEIIEQYKDDLDAFLVAYAESVKLTETDVEGTAVLCEEYGITTAAVAEVAIPECKIVCITDEQMKSDLSNYLSVLFDQDPTAIGGSLPNEDFYYTK